jgi:hypothetical protein
VTGYTATVLNDVMDERDRQDAKWGQQDHEPARYLMILGEEYGEACEAGCRLTFGGDGDTVSRAVAVADLRMELVQVAAVAVAMIESIDRGRNKPTDAQHNDLEGLRGGVSTETAAEEVPS